MKYSQTVKGIFVKRLNRFIAEVLINDHMEKVHVKNTGRLKELLLEKAEVALAVAENPNRKTKYSLIAVKNGDRWINIDSQVPNEVVFEGLIKGKISELGKPSLAKKEVTFGNSRFDLYFEKNGEKGFIEVKGVTLEDGGVAMFPDAPTSRGTKHILEMKEAVHAGYRGIILFLIQMNGCHTFTPNEKMDKAFADACREAAVNGVEILAYDTTVTEKDIVLNRPVKAVLD